MKKAEYSYLRYARFKEIANWSVSHILGMNMGFTNAFPMTPIGQIIERSQKPIGIEDALRYKQITLKTNGGGAVLRDEKQGKDIGTKKQYVVSTGQFIMSKIDARNGAFGLITGDLDGAVVTADFPVFDINSEKVVSQYLFLLSSTKAFARFAQSCSRGTTNRQRIDIGMFLSKRIPLPSCETQQLFVDAYDEKIKKARMLEQQAEQIGQDIEDYLRTELGINNNYKLLQPTITIACEPQAEYGISHQQNADVSATYKWGDEIKKEYRFLKFLRFKDINEWGYNLMTNHKSISSLYPTKKVKDICSLGSGGTPSRSIPKYYQGNIPWIKTGEVVNDLILDTEEHISPDAIENSSAKLYPKGSLIIAMYGQGDTRGRTAKMGIDATTNQACAVLFNINNDLVTTDYLWYYFQGRYNDLRSLASGNNQPNLNAGKINNYDVVIPPLEIQNAIVEHINEQKAQIKKLKKQAEELRKEALVEFEKEIFE